MTRISKYRLDKDLEQEIFTMFWGALSHLRSSHAVSSFFSDLLSDTEEVMLAKRFAVALLLLRGQKPVTIAATIHVSFSMIRGVSEWLTRATTSTKSLLDRVQASQDITAFFDTLESLMDKLPPRWGTNWHEAGKAKWQRLGERSARSSLR